MSAQEAALIWCPFADGDSAAQAAELLLNERLVACVNIIPAVRSIYLWEGKIEAAGECGVLFKTQAPLLERAIARLAEIHPYEAPAITGWRCDTAAPATLAWLAELANPGRP